MEKFSGKVSYCLKHSAICNFDCCCHSNPKINESIIPQSSILLAPGELKGKQGTNHIFITMNNYFGGSLGFCDPEKIDQSQCDSSLNYKPLDCQSYPFFPRLIDGLLVLYKDSRCPLGEKNPIELQKMYSKVISLWSEIIKDPNVQIWVNQVELLSYRLYTPQNESRHY